VRALVVLSHPEPSSFAAALARTAAQTLGTEVVDLYAEGFDPRLTAAVRASAAAMAKGWIDRVFANGVAYDYPGTPAWTGPLSAKRALAIFTSSYEESDFAAGRAGSVDAILYPLLWGTLAYTGMQVLQPYVAYAADSVDEGTRTGYLAALRDRLAVIGDEQPLALARR